MFGASSELANVMEFGFYEESDVIVTAFATHHGLSPCLRPGPNCGSLQRSPGLAIPGGEGKSLKEPHPFGSSGLAISVDRHNIVDGSAPIYVCVPVFCRHSSSMN